MKNWDCRQPCGEAPASVKPSQASVSEQLEAIYREVSGLLSMFLSI